VKNWFSHRRSLKFHTRKSLNSKNAQNPCSNQETKKEEESKNYSHEERNAKAMKRIEVPLNLLPMMGQRIQQSLQFNNIYMTMLYMQNIYNVYEEILKRDQYMRIIGSLLKN